MPRRAAVEERNLDLVPIMNLVSILIPFLLLGVSYVEYAVVETELPAICGVGCGDTQVPEKPDLNIVLHVQSDGVLIKGADEVLGTEREGGGVFVPCTTERCVVDDSYDYQEITRLLTLVKEDYPHIEDLVLVPENRVPYKSMIGVMDAARDNPENGGMRLFPYQTVAGGSK